jgi:hypothetical protein
MQTRLAVDHSLVARVQQHTTGATAHDVYQLLGCYYELADANANDEVAAERMRQIEQRLRSFCVTGRVPREA